MAVNTALKAQHLFICGKSGSGKSSNIKERMKKAPRVIVFDPEDEYSNETGFIRVESAVSLMAVLKARPAAKLKVAYVGEREKAFAAFCKIAFAWGDCLAVAEEISDVTTPAKAPQEWGRLIRRGRKHNIIVCGITNSPAESDKTMIRNAAVIQCFALGNDADRVTMAREMGVTPELIATMKNLDYLEYTRDDLTVFQKRLGTRINKKIR